MLTSAPRFPSLSRPLALAGLLACTLPVGTRLSQVVTPTRAFAAGEAAREGAALFATRGCTHCHGPQGAGTDSGPSLRELRKRTDAAAIEHQIVHGGEAMPAFGGTLDPAQVKSLVSFLRAKHWIAADAPAVHGP